MSFNGAMNQILPTQDGKSAHVTGDFGEPRSKGPNGGVDFNYVGSGMTIKTKFYSFHMWVYLLVATLLLAGFSIATYATTFDEMNQGFTHCDLDGIYLDIATKQPIHSYFKERNMKPYKIEEDFAYFKIKENLYELPVDEVAIPASTFAVYRLFINLPLMQARKLLKNRFGSEFKPSKHSRNGERPELVKDEKNSNRSVMICWNRSGL